MRDSRLSHVKVENIKCIDDYRVYTGIEEYATRLNATTLIIHEDFTISLYCKDGCICERYSPTIKELFG